MLVAHEVPITYMEKNKTNTLCVLLKVEDRHERTHAHTHIHSHTYTQTQAHTNARTHTHTTTHTGTQTHCNLLLKQNNWVSTEKPVLRLIMKLRGFNWLTLPKKIHLLNTLLPGSYCFLDGFLFHFLSVHISDLPCFEASDDF